VGLFRRRAALASASEGGSPAGDPVAVFSGGLLSWSGKPTGMPVTTSRGLARLEFYGWGIRVRGKGLLRRLLPAFEARFEELSSTRPLFARMGNKGIFFAAGKDREPIVFWTTQSDEILAQLERQGVRANRSEVRVKQLYEIDELPR
jgi:hypothetical protein